jgi:hypothetical protein
VMCRELPEIGRSGGSGESAVSCREVKEASNKGLSLGAAAWFRVMAEVV